MKFLIDNWYLIAIAVASGGLLLWPILKEGGRGLNAQMAVQLINRERALLIDVGSPEEFASIHAKGAKNIPLKELEAKLGVVAKKKDATIIFICPMGRRAASAASIAQKLGYTQAQALSGGLKAWQTANMPIEKAIV